jgi:streptogramin lyase
MTKIPIEDATLEDVTYTDSAIYAVLSSGSSYGVDARTFVVSLSYEGEILKTYETPKGLSREPEGIMVSSSGDVFVYGTAKNVPLRATRLEALLQPDEAWVAKVILEK